MRTLSPAQVLGARRLVEGRQVACFLEPGQGKTALTLTALKDLDWPRTLVLAPALVADTVWHAEAALWPHLANALIAPCTGGPEARTNIIRGPADVVVMSYENLPWLLTTFGDPSKLFQCIVFDELSKMKHAGSGRFSRLRTHLHKIPYRFGLTGTPVGNHLIDIWGEMFAIADAKPLGPSFAGFQHEHFTPVAWNQYVVTKWATRPGAEASIHRRIKPWAFTMPPEKVAMPELRVNILPVRLPPAVETAAAELRTELATKLATGEDLYAFSAATAAMKVRQLASGAVYIDQPTILGEPAPLGPKKWVSVHGAKMQALEELVSELQGEPLLIFYWFRHEKERLLAHFKGLARDIHEVGILEKWNQRKVEILLAHPASAGHGLNLQHGGHNICWFTLPWSLELWKQGNGREVRRGQPNPWVAAHVLLAGAVDEMVLQVLASKAGVEDRLLAAMLD